MNDCLASFLRLPIKVLGQAMKENVVIKNPHLRYRKKYCYLRKQCDCLAICYPVTPPNRKNRQLGQQRLQSYTFISVLRLV